MNIKRTGIGTSVMPGIWIASAKRTNAPTGEGRNSTEPTYLHNKTSPN